MVKKKVVKGKKFVQRQLANSERAEKCDRINSLRELEGQELLSLTEMEDRMRPKWWNYSAAAIHGGDLLNVNHEYGRYQGVPRSGIKRRNGNQQYEGSIGDPID